VAGVARHGLESESPQDFGVSQDHLHNGRTGSHGILQPVPVNARGGTRDLHNVAPRRLEWGVLKRQANQSLPSKRGHFSSLAAVHVFDQGNNDRMGEVGVLEVLTYFSENRSTWQLHKFKVRLQPMKVLRWKGSQEHVAWQGVHHSSCHIRQQSFCVWENNLHSLADELKRIAGWFESEAMG
jgi:hypothetical protein